MRLTLFSLAVVAVLGACVFAPAGARAADFTVTRRYVHAPKYPTVLADIVVMWPGDKALPHSRRGKHGYDLRVTESGKPVEGARLVLKERVNGRGEVVRVVYRSRQKEATARPLRISLSHPDLPGAAGVIAFEALGPVQTNGFAVVAFEHKDRKKAHQQYERYVKQGLPEHDGFPRVTEGMWLRGHEGKRWTVLAGIPTERAVADKLAAFILASGWKPRVEAVEADAFEQLRLFVLKSNAKPGKDPKWKDIAPATLAWLGFSGSSASLSWPKSSARPAKDGQLVLPYLWPPWPAKELRVRFDHARGFDWYCASIDLSLPAKTVWIAETEAPITTDNCAMVGD